MPSTLTEWLAVIGVLIAALTLIGSTIVFCSRLLLWLSRIYWIGKAGIQEVKILRRDHETLKAAHRDGTKRLVHTEQTVARHDESIAQIEEQLGLA